MDACFIRVTDFENVNIGDVVTLMGREDQQEISPHDIAEDIGSVSYEVISRFSKRLPRVYIQNGHIVGVKSVLNIQAKNSLVI